MNLYDDFQWELILQLIFCPLKSEVDALKRAKICTVFSDADVNTL